MTFDEEYAFYKKAFREGREYQHKFEAFLAKKNMTKNFCDKCGGVLQPNGIFRFGLNLSTTAFKTVETVPMGVSHAWMFCQNCFDETLALVVGKPIKLWRESCNDVFPLRLF